MRKLAWLILALLLILPACQRVETTVTILADGHTYLINAGDRIPAKWLSQAKLTLGNEDRLIYHGTTIQLDEVLPKKLSYTLTVRRAMELTVYTPDGQKKLLTSALTVGQALEESGYALQRADRLDPPADTPLDSLDSSSPPIENYRPSQELTITIDGNEMQIRSTAASVGQALAESGISLVGLDYSIPSESNPLPGDGKIRVVRVSESVALTESSIPYGTRTELSADLELDQQALLQGGEPGLKVIRTRSRNEDGIQVSQASERESIVRLPQDRVLGIGTKVVIRSAVVDGVNIEYWRALTLYATPYVPCVPGTNDCHYGTASGTRVRKGEAALVYPWYLLLAGERVFVPGYGFANIEDNNGALTSAYWGTYWIDLGYAKLEDIDWVNHYVTVYFLTPVPANIADLYIMP